jgi:hypothetical protein
MTKPNSYNYTQNSNLTGIYNVIKNIGNTRTGLSGGASYSQIGANRLNSRGTGSRSRQQYEEEKR